MNYICLLWCFPMLKARPRPFFCTLNQPSSQWISFDVPQDRKHMIILLNGKSFKTPLPDVTASLVVLVVAPYMRRQQPLHPSAEIAV